MFIRNLEERDFHTLWRLDWSPLIKERDSIYLVISVDQRDVSFVAEEAPGRWMGVLLGTRSSDTRSVYVNHLLVLPAFRGRGVGSALLEHMKGRCRSMGVERIWLFTSENNRRFYERYGFEVDYSFLEREIGEYVKRVKGVLVMKTDLRSG